MGVEIPEPIQERSSQARETARAHPHEKTDALSLFQKKRQSVGKDLGDEEGAVGFVDPDGGLGEVGQHDIGLVGRGGQPGFDNDVHRGELLGDLDQVFTRHRVIHRNGGDGGAAVGTGMPEGSGALLRAEIGCTLKLVVITENAEPVGTAVVINALIDLTGKTGGNCGSGTGDRLGCVIGNGGGLIALGRLRGYDRAVRHHDDGTGVNTFL